MHCASIRNRTSAKWIAILALAFAGACSESPGLPSQGGGGGAVALQSLSVELGAASVPAGTKVPVGARASFVDGTSRDVTAEATWTVSEPTKLEVVPSEGVAKARVAGASVISAVWNGVTATAPLDVTQPIVLWMNLSPTHATLPKGTTTQLQVDALLSDGAHAELAAWSTSNASVATVDQDGRVTGNGAGEATISATLGGAIATAAVTVTAPVVDAVIVSPAPVTLPLGVGQRFTATAVYSDQHTTDVTVSAQWSSSDPTVASLSGAALSTVAAGATTVSATYQGKTGTAAVTVTAPAVARIVISTEPVFLRLPTQFRATAIYTDANHTADVTANAEWTSLDTASATVAAGGIVTGVAPGPATISATFADKTGSAEIVVDGSALESVELWPVNGSGPVGFDRQLTATARFADGLTKDVTGVSTWASSAPSIGDFVSGRPGLLRPAKAGGPITLTATVLEISGTTQFTVTGATLVSMQVRGDLSRIALGTKTTFHASGTFSDGSTLDPLPGTAWTSDDEAVATIDPAGVALGVAAGSARITGTLASCPVTAATCSASAPLTVTSAVIGSIAIAPASVAIPVGVRQPLTLTASISDGSAQDLTPYASWASADPSIAKLDASLPWVVIGVAPGATVVTARYGTPYGTFSASRGVAVTGAHVVGIDVTAPADTLIQGRSMQLAARATFDDGSAFDVTDGATWSSTAAGVAAVSNGVATHGVVTGVYAGTATLSAALGSQSGSVDLIVRPFITAIAVTPADASIPLGRTQQFTATATYSDGSEHPLSDVAWASSNPGVGDISTGGLLATSLQGVTTVTATDPEFHVVGQVQVTVGDPVIESLIVAPAYASLAAGEQQVFTATATMSDGRSDVDVTGIVEWTSSDATVGTLVGNVLTTSTSGATVVTATDPTTQVAAQAPVQVTGPILRSIVVAPAVNGLALGQTVALVLSGTMTDGTAATSITGAVWSSSAPAIATVDQGGYVQTSGQGTAVITVTVAGVEPASATVNVGPKALRSILIVEQNPTVPLGTALALHVDGTYTDHSTETLTSGVAWGSANAAVATVDATTGLVTTLAKGSSLVTATFGSLSDSTTVTVTDPKLLSIAVDPATITLPLGTTQQFKVNGTCSNGPCTVSGPVSWSVSSGAASIATTGLLQTLLEGTTTVTATVAGVQPATATVTVTPPAVTEVRVTGDTVYVNVPTQFTATAVYTNGTEADVTRSATWSTTDTAYATVASGGVVVGIAPGGATITAAFGGKSGSAQAEVRGATLTSLEIAPADAIGPLGYDQQFSATVLFTDTETGDPHTADVTSLSAWSSSVKAVADFVDPARPGLLHPYKAGTTSLTATYRTLTASTGFTVVNAQLDSIDVLGDSYRIGLGTKTAFAAWGNFSDKQGNVYYLQLTDVTWSSSAPAVATIDASGVALGVSPGTTTIQATLNSCPLGAATCSGQAPLQVTNATIVSLSVESPPPFPVGISVQLSAIATMSDGSTQDLTEFSSWHSADRGVASVDPSGEVTGVTPGTTTVTATYAWSVPLTTGSVSGTATITVNDATLQDIVVTSASPKNLIPEGYKVQLFAAAVYSDGSQYDVTNVATWISDNSGILSVSNATGTRGLATGMNLGDATVQAWYRGLHGDLPLKVIEGKLNDVIITSAAAAQTELPSLTLDPGPRRQLYASGVFTTTSYGDVYIDMTDQCSWWAQPKTVAQVSNVISKFGRKGLVTGVAPGDATITVHKGVYRDDLAVHVN